MADLAISRNVEAERTGAVSADTHGRERREPPPEGQRRHRDGASPELALALGESVTVVYEQGPDGEPLIRVLDNERGETLAILTPDELRSMTADTGLPPGLLLRVSS